MRLKQSLGLFSGFLALATLTGCMTGNDSDGPTFAIAADAEVLDIEPPDAEAGVPGVLSTVSTDYSCQEGEVEETETPEDFLYAISGGSLYLWHENECTAMKFSGTSSTIRGTWTSTDLSARIPSKYRPATCDTVSPEDFAYDQFLNNAVVTYTITSSKITGTIKGDFCYSDALVEAYEDRDGITVVADNCSTVKMTNEDLERTATVTVTYKDDKLTQTVVYNGQTCKATVPVYLSSKEPVCSEEQDETYAEEAEAFQDCLEESEFNEDFNGSAAKGNSPQMSIEKALKRALPF